MEKGRTERSLVCKRFFFPKQTILDSLRFKLIKAFKPKLLSELKKKRERKSEKQRDYSLSMTSTQERNNNKKKELEKGNRERNMFVTRFKGEERKGSKKEEEKKEKMKKYFFFRTRTTSPALLRREKGRKSSRFSLTRHDHLDRKKKNGKDVCVRVVT